MPYLATKMSTLLLVTSLSAASAADQNVWDECTHPRDSDASIAACTKILQDADETISNRAIAYYARAGVYKTKGTTIRPSQIIQRRSRLTRTTLTRKSQKLARYLFC
jgi:hypothetical protein